MSRGWGGEGVGELERGNVGPGQGLLVVQRALIKATCSWFCLESKKPGELVVVFTNTANYWVFFFFFWKLGSRRDDIDLSRSPSVAC